MESDTEKISNTKHKRISDNEIQLKKRKYTHGRGDEGRGLRTGKVTIMKGEDKMQ